MSKKKTGDREGVSHPQHYYHNVWNKWDAEHATTASYNRQAGTNRPIMMVKGTSNGFVKEQRRPPYSASCSLRPTCPDIDAHTMNEGITEAVRIEQIRASRRFKELASALGGRRVVVHTHCGSEAVNVGDHG